MQLLDDGSLLNKSSVLRSSFDLYRDNIMLLAQFCSCLVFLRQDCLIRAVRMKERAS